MRDDQEQRFETFLRDAVRDYHRPPATPREELWARIAAARDARRRRTLALRPWLRWGVGIAAVLVIGMGIRPRTARGARGPAAEPHPHDQHGRRTEEHNAALPSPPHLVCALFLGKKKLPNGSKP